MNGILWRATLSLSGPRLHVQVHRGRSTLMHADLPHPAAHPLALRTVLEGLALWQGAALSAACDVGGRAADGYALDRIDGGLYVPPSPLLDVWTCPKRPDRRGGGRCRG